MTQVETTQQEEELIAAPWQRRGRFKIPHKLLVEDFEGVGGIFELCVPVRAEMMFDQDVIEYTAIGHVFDEISEGYLTPWYTVSIYREGLTVGIDFIRITNI